MSKLLITNALVGVGPGYFGGWGIGGISERISCTSRVDFVGDQVMN